ncbi:MAG: heme-copper oxidase subunit III [Deltaproteobacteria bacterium]|nr:heme-copper oxidase subunit III [Deltaproteobacteria bacterium]
MSAAPALPRRGAVPDAVLGMALFLFTEVMLFAGLLSAYLVLRGKVATWPPPGQPRLPVLVTLGNTLVLLASGYVARRARREPSPARWLRGALALGGLFLAVQGAEWLGLVAHGLDARTSLYASTFYVLVGAHAAHVTAAVAALAWGARALERGRLSRGALEALVLYWTFCVAVWPPLYALVYLW